MPQGLGRGLSSLIPKKVATDYTDFNISNQSALALSGQNQIVYVSPSRIQANPYQPRRDFQDGALNDLMASIKEHGIIQPLVVTKVGNDYELIAGERRWRSAKLLGLKEVPVIICEASNQKKLELALIENLQRENLNPIESAVAYNQLINEFNLTQEAVAQRVGKARSSVANGLRLLTLPNEIQRAVAENRISEAHAKYLLSLESTAKQLVIFKKILHQNLSVADTDTLIKRLKTTGQVKDNYQDDPFIKRLQVFFGTKATIQRGAKGGKIIINFIDDSELKEIMKHIT